MKAYHEPSFDRCAHGCSYPGTTCARLVPVMRQLAHNQRVMARAVHVRGQGKAPGTPQSPKSSSASLSCVPDILCFLAAAVPG